MRPLHGEPCGRPQIENAYGQAEDGAHRQTHIGGAGRTTLPEDAKQEDGCHGRGNEAQHGLEYVKQVQTLDGIDGHGHHNSQYGTDKHHDAAHEINLPLGGAGLEVLDIDIHGEHRREGIEGRADGGHQTGGQHSKYQAYHAYGKQVLNHGQVGFVGILQCVAEQGEADDAG